MKKQSFLIGALILTVGGIFAKLVGAFYKIPLTNILGSNGMGLYYLVFPLYSLVLVLISSGTSLAVVRFVSIEKQNNNIYNQKLIFKVALIYVFVLSLIFGVLFSISWTPCIGTFLSSALLLIAKEQEILKGIILMLIYSVGLGIPFIISAIFIEKLKTLFDFIKENYGIVKKVSGLILIVMGIYMFF